MRRPGQAFTAADEEKAPIFTPAHLEYLQARFGNFKQHQSPHSLNDMITVSHLASEQIGASKVLDHISSLISAPTEDKPQADILSGQSAAFAAPSNTTID